MPTDAFRERIVRTLREGAELRLRLIESCAEVAAKAAEAIQNSMQNGGRLLLFGNGGSAADAQHIAAEFVCRFVRERDPLPALALTTDTSILTAVSNDYGFDHVFARQIHALSGPADVVLAISTSGRSPNVLAGVKTARQRGLKTIGLTGGDGGPLARLADIAIIVPSKNTALVQECHIALGHILCEATEMLLLGQPGSVAPEKQKKGAAMAARK